MPTLIAVFAARLNEGTVLFVIVRPFSGHPLVLFMGNEDSQRLRVVNALSINWERFTSKKIDLPDGHTFSLQRVDEKVVARVDEEPAQDLSEQFILTYFSREEIALSRKG